MHFKVSVVDSRGIRNPFSANLGKLNKEEYVEKRKELAADSVQTVYRISGKGRSTCTEYHGFLEAMVLKAGQGGSV